MDSLTLTKQRDDVLALLETRWKWLDANPNHPLFREREDACLDALKEYERLEDAIRSQPVAQTAFADRADRWTS